MPEGSVGIARVGSDPELYAVTFTTRQAVAGADATTRTFTRLEDVRDFLHQAGLPDERCSAALSAAGQGGTVSIAGVVLEDRELRNLGLRTSSGSAAKREGT